MLTPSIWECILRLTLSALLGGLIGLERELRLKWAGVRTHLIVSFAACMMMLVSKYGFFDVLVHDSIRLDPSRIAAGAVTGIGFLGAGTIFSQRRGVTGLTTAAGLWATLGIGMAIGTGMYPLGVFGAALIIVCQAILYRDHTLLHRVAAVLIIHLDDTPDALDRLDSLLAELDLKPSSSKYQRKDGVIVAELELDRLPCPDNKLGQLLLPLVKEPCIQSVHW